MDGSVTYVCRLSIHDLTRRSTQMVFPRYFLPQYFQFTTSQGGRPCFQALCHLFSIFQFTTSQGGRLMVASASGFFRSFQFTTSQGGRPPQFCQLMGLYPFQFTTSQGGRHVHVIRAPLCIDLSIHDLTRRSTHLFWGSVRNLHLSIHDLTRRSTGCPSAPACPEEPFNSRPHKEVDRGMGAGVWHD